jgi:tRNA pseudouridine55 synthase
MKEGIFAFYKPSGPSSARFLNTIKRQWDIPKETKVGHGGTLDPLADGVLVVAIGKEYTKQLSHTLKGTDKEYEVEMVLGYESNTFDKEGALVKNTKHEFQNSKIKGEEIERAVEVVANRKEQVPPAFSAVKVGGKRAYSLARKGEEIVLFPKPVEVKGIKLLTIEEIDGDIHVRVRLITSSGFYVRSFVHDVGRELGTGAYMNALTRTRVGEFTLDEAIRMEN